MKKLILPVFLLFGILVGSAEGKFSARTQCFIDKIDEITNVQNTTTKIKGNIKLKSTNTLIREIEGVNYVDMFIELTDPQAVSEIENLGGMVGVQFGNLITATIPVNQIETISTLGKVKRMDIARLARTKNDVARTSVGMDNVLAGTGLPKSYDGTGVIYGTLDTGIDFNHYAFCNADYSSRILYAYLPENSTGTKVTGNVYDTNGNFTSGGTFPGSEFNTSKISSLSTDDRTETHGSHTMGIGAGGWKGNDYYGMAPKADIIACGSTNLSDVTMINSISYVFGKAESLNQPVVMNLSLGVNIGAHDGSSYVPYLIDKLTGPGKIVVMSAGNEGDMNLHVNKKFTSSTDALKTFFASSSNDYKNLSTSSAFDFWSKGNTSFTMNVVVYNTTTNAIEYTSNSFNAGSGSLALGSNSSFKTYYTGTFNLYGDYVNGKYNIYGELAGTLKASNYRLGVVITSQAGAEIDGWTDAYDLIFGNGNVSGWQNGDTDCSINDMATGANSISVGAYVSRKNYTSIDGSKYSLTDNALNDIASFSSYGPDANGNDKPDIVAPGFVLISAISYYCSDYSSSGAYRNELALESTINNKKQRWGIMAGTSMSSPCVAGIIATWLQANPNLTPADIKSVFDRTAKSDSYVVNGGTKKWGKGKIDAYQGLLDVIKGASVEGAISDSNKAVIVYPNPSDGNFAVTIPNEVGNISINVYDMNGMLAATKTYNANGETIQVDFKGELTSGIYVLQVKGNNTLSTTRLVIK